MSTTPRPDEAVRNAKINEAVAEDVARGMAEKAEREQVRANLYATSAAQKSEVAEVLRQNTERAQAESRSTKFTLYLVLGILFIGAIAAAAYFMSRPAPVSTSEIGTTARPTVSANPTPGPGLVQSNPNPNAPLRPVSPPSVVRVPPSVAAVPSTSLPARTTLPPSPRAAQPVPAVGASGDKPLQGYVDPKGQ